MPKEAEKKFTEFLKKKDLKLTSQRRTILNVVTETKGHFTAEGLLDLSKKKDPTISKASVYRTLDLLKGSELVEEQDFGNGKKSYELALGRKHHDHFVCVKCGKILEFENESIEHLQRSEAKKHQFRVVYHSLKLFGFCRSCG